MHNVIEDIRGPMTGRTPYRWAVTGLLLVSLAGFAGCSGDRSRVVAGGDEPEVADNRDFGLVLDRARERNDEALQVDRLRRRVEEFQLEFGRAPTNLAELVSVGMIDRIPKSSEGIQYRYDPAGGNIMQIRMPIEVIDEQDLKTAAPDIPL